MRNRTLRNARKVDDRGEWGLGRHSVLSPPEIALLEFYERSIGFEQEESLLYTIDYK
jgi:hypothetical protein